MNRMKGLCWHQNNVKAVEGKWYCQLNCYDASLYNKDSLIRHYLTKHEPAPVLAAGVRIDKSADGSKDGRWKEAYFGLLGIILGRHVQKGGGYNDFVKRNGDILDNR